MKAQAAQQTNKQLKEIIRGLHRDKKVPFVVEKLSGLLQFFYPTQELKINDAEVHSYSPPRVHQDSLIVNYKDIRKIYRLVLAAEKITEFDMPVVHDYTMHSTKKEQVT